MPAPPPLPGPRDLPLSPPDIRLLSPATIDRIAAGEVIERPAAAVRELVENALDAGATRIAVVLEGDGVARIEVADDGCGMDAAQLALAVQRHATSKLGDDSDLSRIATLGFRGEALPSIGAAALLRITSRPAGAPHAWRIAVDGGVAGAVVPAAGPAGTCVEVRDLFHATPARRKFLKSPRAEAEASEAAIRRLALAAPWSALRLESDGRVLFDLPAQPLAARVAALLDPEAAHALLPVAAERGVLRLSGYAATPSLSRATVGGQALVVNGRPVADPVLRAAVRVAYRPVIAANRHAVVALFLDLPPEDVDVNVHPAKAEVRFREPDAVRALVIGGLSRALAAGAGGAPAPRTFALRPTLRLVAPPTTAPRGLAETPLPFQHAPAARPPQPNATRTESHPLGAVIGQVLDTYVIAVAADGALVLVDQHAAHERLTHEALREQHLAGGVQTQPLLMPAVVDLPPGAVRCLLAHAAALGALGLEIEAFGPGAVLVRTLPALLGTPDPAPLLRDLADELADADEGTALDARLDAAIARLACHGSIRAGRRLSGPEMEALLRRMEATPRAATCSHGRPTFLKLSRAEIERLFGRR